MCCVCLDVTCFSAVFPAAPLLVIFSLSLIGHGLLWKCLQVAQRPIQQRAADIGAWTSVLTFLSFASIFSNCILIFHASDVKTNKTRATHAKPNNVNTGNMRRSDMAIRSAADSFFSSLLPLPFLFQQWERYSGGFSRSTTMLGFALILFVLKVLLMAFIPDEAGWVTTRLLAAKYRRDKELASELTAAQSKEAIEIERQYMRRRIDKLKLGVKAAEAEAATATSTSMHANDTDTDTDTATLAHTTDITDTVAPDTGDTHTHTHRDATTLTTANNQQSAEQKKNN